ncbi:MAG: hypothetical protein NZ841_05155 [Dictyoglomus sp.]|nr:hypothetical protein [Dictyoglomus sp.]MCX7942203.1 hypothetical protein [Dictyoglomaceae bacterium]MDW8188666.1 hypothetical protein [Dictyoglomus sp.]
MKSFLGWKIKDVFKFLSEDNVILDLDYPFLSQESFGDLRVIMEKFENGKWFFVLSYENYQERK